MSSSTGRSIIARQIPFLDVKAGYIELREELDAAYRRVMDSGSYILGAEVEAFEEEFARYCGAEHAVGVGNGLDALHLILAAAHIGAGDEVIVPANTFIATWLAVTQAGARPVPVEPDARTYNLDATAVAAAITSSTRAIIAVHLYGQSADMAALRRVADHYALLLIEDAAQAQGARFGGRRVGTLGDAAGFSFYPGKNLGAFGDAGAVTTNDAALAGRIRSLRSYGSRVKYDHEMCGFNSRLDPMQAAFLRIKLWHLDDWNTRRRDIATRYQERLRDCAAVSLPIVHRAAEPVWHIYFVRSDDRDALRSHLAASGIGTLIHYPVPPHLSPAYGYLGWREGAFPITERLAKTGLSVPIGPHLADADVDFVSECLRSFGRA